MIRAAAAHEAAELTALVRRSKAYWGYSPEFIERAAAELAVSENDIATGGVCVAEFGGRRVGVSVLKLTEPAELVALFVEPDTIAKGVGRALLQHNLEWAKRAGLNSVLIESDPNAEPFYRANGAIHVGYRRSPASGRDLPLLRIQL